MEKFDAIVVGAGPAGATAACLLARAGMQVIVIERGETPGSKNVSGALLFSQVYSEIFPKFWESAPLERAIVGHAITFLGEQTSVNLDYRDLDEGHVPHNAYSVLRARFDPWMAQQAEDAGAMLMSGFTVDKLLQENGRVVGIEAGGDTLMADVVVVAEGTRSGLLKEAGLRTDEYHASDVSIGVKEVIALPADVITNRFQCLNADEGVAYTCVGHTGGVEGGGFLYTNKDTLSVGVVAKIDAVYKSKLQPHAILNEFKSHPFISRLIAGGEIVEYSAQAIHRGGVHLIGQLYGDGYVVVGSAARLLLNNVMTLRGMDVAVASAAAAAKAILAARETGDYSHATLAGYEQNFKATNVYKDMVTFKDTYPLLENERLFHVYPELAGAVLGDMFTVGAKPSKKGLKALRDDMRGKVSLWQMLMDMNQIGKGLVR